LTSIAHGGSSEPPLLAKERGAVVFVAAAGSRLHFEVEVAAGTAASKGKTTPELIAAVFTSYFG
jgi:hypothetical protein